MSRQLVRSPEHDRRRSLGWLALAWMEELTVHGRGDARGAKVHHGDEMSGFVADCYGVSKTGRLLYDSAFFSRPKGADKSGLGARLALFEALGPCRFAGFAKGGEVYEDPFGLGFRYAYERGEPMGRPIVAPYVRCLATEEGQVGNVYDSIFYNLDDSDAPLSKIRGLDAGLGRIIIPGGGRIVPATASSASKDGGLETFVVFDESHLYNNPELRRMYETVSRNMRKRKRSAGTWYLETTTMFAPGEDSIAERSYSLAADIEEGRTKRAKHLSDHQWGECEDLTDEEALRKAVEDAFGDAIGFNDLDGIIDGFYDPRNDPADSRRFFLNAPTSTANAWLAAYEWNARLDKEKIVARADAIVLGFDGSRKRSRGVTDATALIGTRVSDGHVFEIAVWEQPRGAIGNDWEVPVAQVDAVVRETFLRFNVVGMFADPAKWESYVTQWEADFGPKLKVKATREHPIHWWMTGGRAAASARALEEFHTAIVEGEMTHDGAGALTRHVLNARNRGSRYGMQIGKDSPDSALKIDAAVAATLSWTCRLAAVAMGIGKRPVGTVRRIR